MFAIVATSGKQFKVSEGDRIVVDRVPANVGETVRLDAVLMLGGDDKPVVGTPLVAGAAVEANVVNHRSGDKRHRRKTGHRQQLSELRIGAIRAPGSGTVERPAASERPIAAERPSARPASRTRKPAAGASKKTSQE